MRKYLLLLALVLPGCTSKPEPVVTTVEVVKPVFKVPPALLATQTPEEPNLAIYTVYEATDNAEALKASYITIIQLQQYSKSLRATLDAYNKVLHTNTETQKKD